MQEITEKQKYELWWEYLLESNAYKAYCEFQRKKRKDPKLKWPRKKLPSMGLSSTFAFFFDVFSNSFEDWWENKEDLHSGIPIYGDKSMEYSKQQATYEFNSTIKRFFKSHGREPSLDEFRKVFIERLFDYLPASFMIRIYMHPKQSNTELKKQFGKLLEEKISQPDVQNWEKELKKGWIPIVGRFRYDELRRYLGVYRLKTSGMKIDDIMEKLDPNVTRNKVDFYQDIRHAKKIIQNVEDGCFPGEYYVKKDITI